MSQTTLDRVLSQFKRYVGTDDCIDMQPVHDVAVEIGRLNQQIFEAQEAVLREGLTAERLRVALEKIASGRAFPNAAIAIAREALQDAYARKFTGSGNLNDDQQS